jgi:Lantibiotic biosynthesis dehydratase C-term
LNQFDPARWSCVYFHYHGDQELLLSHLLVPIIHEQVRRNSIDRFFFVRYRLGGPHLRLRLRRQGAVDAQEVLRQMGERAGDFFAEQPSRRSWAAEEIRRRNRAILASDPSEDDDAVYPDNSWRAVPFRPEVERYGGDALLPLSLDLFTVSSVAALDTLALVRGAARSRQYAVFFGLLAGLAQGIARDFDELSDLLARQSPPREALAEVVKKADRVFAAQRETLCRVFAAGGDDLLTRSARRLRTELDGLEPRARRRVCSSHIHMTANRLGLGHSEELYLGRLLSLAAQEVGGWAPASPVESGPCPDFALAALERFTARWNEFS